MTPTYAEALQWLTPLRELRFWQKVNKREDGCWIWTGALTDSGHGQLTMDGGNVRVHRLVWILTRQRDIEHWVVVRHLMCDNKPCCNPAHLVGGTQGENVKDEIFIHSAFDTGKRQSEIEEYAKQPYIGYFSEKISPHFTTDVEQSVRFSYAHP